MPQAVTCVTVSPVLITKHFDRNLSKIRGISGENTPESTTFTEENQAKSVIGFSWGNMYTYFCPRAVAYIFKELFSRRF